MTTRKGSPDRIGKLPHPKLVRIGPSPVDRAEGIVKGHPGRHFGTIESAHEYVAMLLRAIEETTTEVGEDLRGSHFARASRRREAFQLVAYKLEQLRFHLAISQRRLNDLRTLRRMLHGERSLTAVAS